MRNQLQPILRDEQLNVVVIVALVLLSLACGAAAKTGAALNVSVSPDGVACGTYTCPLLRGQQVFGRGMAGCASVPFIADAAAPVDASAPAVQELGTNYTVTVDTNGRKTVYFNSNSVPAANHAVVLTNT